MDVINFKRQHKEVMNLANYISDNIRNNTVSQNLNQIVKNINTISGKLKIHLLIEDEYLYPYLLSSKNVTLNTFGQKYSEEMKGVAKAYEDYKSKYNTVNTITQNMYGFKEDTKQVLEVLSNRIGREESELYPLLG